MMRATLGRPEPTRGNEVQGSTKVTPQPIYSSEN